MILLDFLFNICFAPFRNAIKGGRIGALFLFTPSLTFILAGIINILFHQTIGRITLSLSPLALAAIMLSIFVSSYFLLDTIYIKRNREIGKMSYPILYVLLLPILLLGSVIFFAFTVDEFA
jgi:hypothetical protein